jgi:hypothetical protein
MFRSVLHVGEFVLQLFEKLDATRETDPAVACLWVESSKKQSGAREQQQHEVAEGGGEGEVVHNEEPIVDLAVYTRNRAMRIYLSTKVGKKTPLYPPKWNLFNIDSEDDSKIHTLDAGRTLSYWISHCGSKCSSGGSSASINIVSMKEKNSDLKIEVTEILDQNGGKREIQTGSSAWEAQFMRDSLITGVRSPLWISQRLRDGRSNVEGGIVETQSLTRAEFASKYSPFALKELMKELADEESLNVGGSDANPTTLRGDPIVELLYCWSQNGRPLGSRFRRFQERGAPSVPLGGSDACDNRAVHRGPARAMSYSGPIATSSGYGTRSFPVTSLVEWVLAEAAGPDHASSTQRAYVRSWTLKRKKEVGENDPAGFILATFEIGGSRFCFNVMRHHRGNHVAWHIDFTTGLAWQTCHDNDCKSFQSRTVDVPRFND